MSDFKYSISQDDELEAILNEVKGSADEAPAKDWSMADIDRLIAQTNGEIYEEPVAPAPAKETAHEKYSRFFTTQFDEDMFTLAPIKDEKPEIEDISSGESDEVFGQEKFYEEDEDFFDPDLFELETEIIPEDERDEQEVKYTNKPVHIEPLPPSIEEKAEEKKDEEKKVIDYRERFFKKLTLEDIGDEPESDPEPEGPVDHSGTVTFMNVHDKNDTFLDPMPTIKAAEDVKDFDIEKTRIAGAVTKTDKKAEEAISNDVEGQMVITGFVDIPEEAIPEKDSEEVVEESLWKKRKQKAKTFVIDDIDDEGFGEGFNEIEEVVDDYVPEEEKKSSEPENVSLVESIGEYTDPSERSRIHTKLAARVKKITKGAVAIGILEAVMFILAILPPIADKLSIETSLFSGQSTILCVINAVLIIAAVALDSERFFDAFTGIVKGKIDGDTAIAVAVAVALVENTLSAITTASAPVFGVIAVAGILISKVTDVINARRVYNNFSVCAFNYEHNMYAVHAFDNESEIFELGRGLLMGNAELLYSSNVDFPANFIKNSDKEQGSEKFTKLLLLISVVGSVIAGVISGAVQKSFMDGFAVAAASIALSAPVFGKFIPSYITYIHNRKLNHEGSMIVSLDAAEKTAAANAVVLDSADIFDRKSCTMHGMKNFETMRIDVVLLYAAAMVIKSGGPLKECFEEVIDGRQDLLPPVRELVYEDKMGISARIYDQKVLLGNRNMLIHHNIEAPDKKLEDKYSHDGRKVIYLACNEKLAALFVVSYCVDEKMKNYMKQLEKSGIQTLVRTNDVNVTEELISERFGIGPNNFKILSSVAGRLYKRRKDAISESLEAEVIHDGKPESMLKAIATSCKMTTRGKVGTALQFVLMAAGIVLSAVMGCSENGISTAGAVLVMAAEIAATLIAMTPIDYLFKKK